MQSADLRSIYNLYSSLLQQASAEFHGLTVELSKYIDQDLLRGNVLNIKACTPLMLEATVQKELLFKQLEVRGRSCALSQEAAAGQARRTACSRDHSGATSI